MWRGGRATSARRTGRSSSRQSSGDGSVARRIGKGGLRGKGSKERPRTVRERETSASRQMPGRSEEEEVRVEPVAGLEVAKAQGSPFAELEARRAAYGQTAARLEL